MDTLVGTVLQNRYKVIEKVAAGGMGVIYRGERLELERPVAIKFVHEWAIAESTIRKRFEIEVRAMGRIHHPCCVSITDFGVHNGAPYVVMDYVEGKTLAEVIEEGPLPIRRALGIAEEILAGLAHAHDKGVVHRDIKPKNIMITESAGFADDVRILDFGLAKLLEQTTGLTIGMAIGTPSYMAPEQTVGDPVDARTDVYALGLVLYEMLAGEPPFWSDESHELMRMQREEPPKPLANVPPHLWSILSCALAKVPGDRYASAGEFATALREGKAPLVVGEAHTVRAKLPGAGTPPATPAPSQPAVRSRGKRFAIVAAACLGTAAVIATITIVASRSGEPAQTSATKPAVDDGKKPRSKRSKSAVATKSKSRWKSKARVAKNKDPLAAVERLIGKQNARALARLRSLKKRLPHNARVRYLLGRANFATPWYSRAIQNYRAAIKMDPSYRSNKIIIGQMIFLFRMRRYHGKASYFLRTVIGRPAIPQLKRAAEKHKNKTVRRRAKWTLGEIRGR